MRIEEKPELGKSCYADDMLIKTRRAMWDHPRPQRLQSIWSAGRVTWHLKRPGSPGDEDDVGPTDSHLVPHYACAVF